VAGASGRDRIAAAFAAARSAGRGAFVPYLTAGFPTASESERLAAALCEEGADVLELGVPFSDPLADGPVIQRTTQISLEAGTTLGGVLQQARRLGALAVPHPPIVLMTYLNPIVRFGAERFAAEAASAGVEGVILVDLPPDEDPAIWAAFDRAGVDTITLVAPSTAPRRLPSIAARARGFLYVVARLGVTGRGGEDGGVVALLDRCREATPLPRCLGFGITPETDLVPYREHAEGIVAGSCLLAPLLESHLAEGEAGALGRERALRSLAAAFRARLAGWRST
jgi:tryptophan synthase alpha chain